MKFLITGGAGFIGSHIAEALVVENKGEVTVFDNLSVGRRENVPRECRFVRGDIRDRENLAAATQGADIVFHEAAFVSIRGSFQNLREELEVNCQGTLNVLETAAAQGVKKLIFASSMAVYGEPQYLPVDEAHPLHPISPYGLSKVRGEQYCQIFREHGLPTVVLRYFNTYGIRQTPSAYVGVTTSFINQALRGEPLTVFGDGDQTRDFVWVRDVARANVLAASCACEGAFNVGSGVEVSVNQLADAVSQRLGVGMLNLAKPPGEIDRIVADISRAKSQLRYRPTGRFLEQLPGLITWWAERNREMAASDITQHSLK